jgi:hypothetical protein
LVFKFGFLPGADPDRKQPRHRSQNPASAPTPTNPARFGTTSLPDWAGSTTANLAGCIDEAICSH